MDYSKIDQILETLQREGKMTRAQFLKITAAMGGLMAFGTTDAYAAKSDVKAKIVIVGGGAAGINVAARLKRALKHPDLTIIDPADRNYYQPGFTLIAGGVYEADEVWKNEADCMPSNVNWIKDSVTLIHPGSNYLETAGNGRVDYDFLVLAPGAIVNWEKVEGISKETLGQGNAHSIYDFEGAQRTWPAMREFGEKGGKGVFCDTYTKHKCGGAPKKICLLSWDNARKNDRLNDIDMHYYTAEGDLYDVPYFTPRLKEIYKERNIPIDVNVRLKGIDTQAKTAYFERVEKVGDETVRTPFTEDYDFMHFMAPQSAPHFIPESGLAWTEGKLAADGWVMVDQYTLVHKTYKNIVSLGDCAGIPTSKTSAAVAKQAPVAVANLVSLMEGKEPTAKYNGYAACPIVTDYGHVLLCEFDYDKKEMISFPFSLLDMSHEQWAAWILKVYMLKPIYFYLMLAGRY